MSKDFYIGRQPILDKEGKVYAYELLYRQQGEHAASVLDNSAATARVLINAIQNMGLECMLSGKKGFINADEEIILGGLIDILPKENFVIEILETTKVTPELVEKIKEYKALGHSFALDDMVLTKEYYDMFKSLFQVVDIIKVDYLYCDKTKLKGNLQVFKKLNVAMLAEKVETQEDFEFCKEVGFDLFQGYFFSKPVVLTQKSVDPSKAATVNLINMIKNDAEVNELESVIKGHTDLYINLLRFMNSASYFTKGNITSIKHAIAMLGRENLAKWLYLILYAGPSNDNFDNPLLVTAQVRAKMMEKLCSESTVKCEQEDAAYLVGLISLMDAVFNRDIQDVVKEFNVDQAIKLAVTEKSGELGRLLTMVMEYENDEPEALSENIKSVGINFEGFNAIVQESIEYAEKFTSIG